MSESFEGARVFTEVMYPDCDKSMLDRLQRAHEHELEQARKSSYHEGYEDGQRSMDAEHRAIAMRLMQLPLDEDSHGNLSQIARAVWHSDFGWTQGACRALRDELVRLLGGVHEPDAALPTYDELEDERQTAVCWLQDWDPHNSFDNDRQGEVHIRILYQLLDLGGAMMMDGADAAVAVRDRLIHLLGGDEPRLLETATELSQASVDAMSRRAKFCKSVETIKSGGECDGELMENGENHKIASITDELRKYVQTDMKRDVSLLNIADRIEAEHAKQCKLLDDSWQATCEQIMKDYEGETAEMRSAIVGYKERAAALEESERLRHELERERDDLRDLLRDARDEYKMLDKKSAETSVNFHAMRDRVWGLQAKLDEYDQTHIELPKDADGEYIHVGDRLWYGSLSDIVSYVGYEPNNKYLETDWSIGTKEDEFDYEEVDGRPLSDQPHLLTHRQPPDPIERLVTQHTLGNLDEQQLIDQLREVMNGRR